MFVISVFSIVAFAQSATKAPEAKTTKKPGEVILEEDIWVILVDEPAHHFHRAHENFLNKEFRASANEIRTAAAFLKLETSRATAEGKEALKASAKELDTLADDVEKGAVTSVKTLDEAFASAHRALAKHHYLKASEAWEKKETKTAGNALKAAARHLERAMTWAGYEEEDFVVKIVNDAGLAAGKLLEGIGGTSEEVGKVIEDMGKAIDKLGKAVDPAKT